MVLVGGKQTRKAEAIRFEPNEIIHVMAENENSIFRGTSKVKTNFKFNGTLLLYD